MRRTIETAIEIRASTQRVWEILRATNAYTEWNPFVRSIEGVFERGKTIKVVLQQPGGGSFTVKPVMLNASFPEIRWKGRLLLDGLFDGEHYFRVEALSAHSTRFVHGEHFSGILIGLMSGLLKKTDRGFALMNEALKKRAEAED
jgi:hypothetical protein